MKSQADSGERKTGDGAGEGASIGLVQAKQSGAGRERFSGADAFALELGLFLGLAIVKFGNPVILDATIDAPGTLAAYWSDPWPTHWANWVLMAVAAPGIWLTLTRWRGLRVGWLMWVLPLVWLGWQAVSAAKTVDVGLTETTLWQLAGCVICYLLGATALIGERGLRWLLIGTLAGFTFCLVRAVEQRVVEFPQDLQFLTEGERQGWTNISPDYLMQLKRDRFVITTNGVDVASPLMLAKLAKARVNGTLVYPNTLAGALLLLLPVSIVLAWNSTRRFRRLTRASVIGLTLFLGLTGFFWTGSKSGWLIGVAMAGVWLLRLKWATRRKWTAVGLVAVIGLAVFAARFHGYLTAGATSMEARFDYWRAAVKTTGEHPVFGTGPGTFQRPYARLKAPESEMAKLAHNDFLEQFSDSGLVGGASYLAWIGLLLVGIGRVIWRRGEILHFAIFIGLLGWFVQGFSEFNLYVPAMAWTAFCLAGWLLRWRSNQIDSLAETG